MNILYKHKVSIWIFIKVRGLLSLCVLSLVHFSFILIFALFNFEKRLHNVVSLSNEILVPYIIYFSYITILV